MQRMITVLVILATQSCVSLDKRRDVAPIGAAGGRDYGGEAPTLRATSPTGVRLEQRRCDPIASRERGTDDGPLPYLEAGIFRERSGRNDAVTGPYARGDCAP